MSVCGINRLGETEGRKQRRSILKPGSVIIPPNATNSIKTKFRSSPIFDIRKLHASPINIKDNVQLDSY